MKTNEFRIPRLLAPAGSWDALVAAVQSGADAVYLGAGDFNARRSAENFEDNLEKSVEYCHLRGVEVNVTLNTMVREDETERLEKTIERIARSGCDGVIVQDFGVVRLLKEMAPDLPLHASTQMAVHNFQGVEFLARQGFAQVVLAREMRFEEIAACRGFGARLEAFVHGALCVSCSGQCLMSSLIGGRSGNRGQCAQPCRMKYTLESAGARREGYLLSTRDLCGLDNLSLFARSGVDVLKIEGRLKRPEYVSLTTRTYRTALDALAENQTMDLPEAREKLAQMFNRGGFTQGYGPGVSDRDLMYSTRPNHMGVPVGQCSRAGSVQLDKAILKADTLVLRHPDGTDTPVHPGDAPEGILALPTARKGDRLIRLVSDAQMKEESRAVRGEHRKIPVSAVLKLRTGQPASLLLQAGEIRAEAAGEILENSRGQSADPDRIREQLRKTGGTCYEITGIELDLSPDAYVPVALINQLRRDACGGLDAARLKGPLPVSPAPVIPSVPAEFPDRPALVVQSDSPAILSRALASGADRVSFAPSDLRPEALESVLPRLPEHFDLVLPMVAGGDTLCGLNLWALRNAARIDRTYLTNIAHFALSWPGILQADASLNIASEAARDALLRQGCKVYTPSVELNCVQIRALSGDRELIVYGALPLMHLRHCPVRSALNLPGLHADCRRCGARPENAVLTDRTGARFPIRRIATDEGCILEVMNSACLMLLNKSRSLPKCSAWRLLIDADTDAEAVIRLHRTALDGGDPRQSNNWAVIETGPTTTGHYFRGVL